MKNNYLIQILSLYLIIYILDVRKMSQNMDVFELLDSYKAPSTSYEDGNLTIISYELLTRKALKLVVGVCSGLRRLFLNLCFAQFPSY